jgi:glycosyltransferase involved in cell wall biosynthesis
MDINSDEQLGFFQDFSCVQSYMRIFENHRRNPKRVKLLFLADLNSAHVIKWASALAGKGYELGIFSLNKADEPWHTSIKGIRVFDPGSFPRTSIQGKSVSKWVYLKSLPALKRCIAEFQPDLVHAHYATSYGLLGALSGFHPFVISAWGSDVMEFPNQSVFHKQLLKFNLNRADLVLATGQTIADAIHRISPVEVKLVSFGIDTTLFATGPRLGNYSAEDVVIGTVKALEPVYGIDILIKAFALLVADEPELSLKLLLVGGGSKEAEYRHMVQALGIQDKVNFAGRVAYQAIPDYHRRIDIFANVSRNESFGVSVLEASACGKPVVVTHTGGLTEVMQEGVTGLAVPTEDIQATVAALQTLARDRHLRQKMGEAGRAFVLAQYAWSNSLEKMDAYYQDLLT